jgi:hypothetical protein
VEGEGVFCVCRNLGIGLEELIKAEADHVAKDARLVAYHAYLSDTYARAARSPWFWVEPDPPEPW